MKKLRKDNGGYALAYVLIIVLVLCAVAMSICTVALRNFQSQERSVVQTRQLYQAEGEIEKFVALAEDLRTSGSAEGYATKEEAQAQAEENCKSSYENELVSKKAKLNTTKGSVVLSIDSTVVDRNLCKYTLTYQNEAVKIETAINIALSYDNSFEKDEDDIDHDGVIDLVEWSCTSNVKAASHTYLSYIITHLNEEEGGEP